LLASPTPFNSPDMMRNAKHSLSKDGGNVPTIRE
jgi:hypothetical protein